MRSKRVDFKVGNLFSPTLLKLVRVILGGGIQLGERLLNLVGHLRDVILEDPFFQIGKAMEQDYVRGRCNDKYQRNEGTDNYKHYFAGKVHRATGGKN